eukprot:8936872-Lingulodinium_polyedra.AAC.1
MHPQFAAPQGLGDALASTHVPADTGNDPAGIAPRGVGPPPAGSRHRSGPQLGQQLAGMGADS